MKILQVNVRCWQTNKYPFTVELSNYNPEIILLNEINLPENSNIKLHNFHSITKAFGNFNGSAILIRKDISFQEIPLKNNKFIAIKIITSLGPLIISTAYIPPRDPPIPMIPLIKLLDYNLPTLIIADFNAHHPAFNNTALNGDKRGRQLISLMKARDLSFLGPSFQTFMSGNRKGKPDLAFGSRQLNLFHHHLFPGKPFGSDHIPIICSLQTVPHKILRPPKLNFNKFDSSKYKSTLENDTLPNLNNKPALELDNLISNINNNIINATNNCTPISNIFTIKNYIPNPLIVQKLKQFQSAYTSHCNFGFPSNFQLHVMSRT